MRRRVLRADVEHHVGRGESRSRPTPTVSARPRRRSGVPRRRVSPAPRGCPRSRCWRHVTSGRSPAPGLLAWPGGAVRPAGGGLVRGLAPARRGPPAGDLRSAGGRSRWSPGCSRSWSSSPGLCGRRRAFSPRARGWALVADRAPGARLGLRGARRRPARAQRHHVAPIVVVPYGRHAVRRRPRGPGRPAVRDRPVQLHTASAGTVTPRSPACRRRRPPACATGSPPAGRPGWRACDGARDRRPSPAGSPTAAGSGCTRSPPR